MSEQETARRTFTYDEAAALVPPVLARTEAAYREVEELQESADAGRLAAGEARRRADLVVTAWASELMSQGVEIKGLWLVDFDNGSGYYCWKYPEPSLQYYHTYEEGFRGRVRIQ